MNSIYVRILSRPPLPSVQLWFAGLPTLQLLDNLINDDSICEWLCIFFSCTILPVKGANTAPSIHHSIHSSTFCCLSGPRLWEQQLGQGSPDLPPPGHLSQLKASLRRDITSSGSPGSAPRPSSDVTCYQSTSSARCSGHILSKCPNPLNQLLLVRRRCESTLSSFRSTELFTLSLRVSPFRKSSFQQSHSLGH